MTIDYKGGKIVWNNYDFDRENGAQRLSEDLLQVAYDHCIIDFGYYGNGAFCIKVIERPDTMDSWAYPIAKIPCHDRADMLVQLQRAIDVYPEWCAKIY